MTSAPFHDWLQVHVTNFAGYYGGYIWEGYVQVVPRGCDSIVTRGIIENYGWIRQYFLTCFGFVYNVPFVMFVPLVPLVSIEMLPG